MNDRISASIGLTCHLGPMGWVLSRGRAGTVSVAAEEVCLGDRRAGPQLRRGLGL